jgi:hypothetical protein
MRRSEPGTIVEIAARLFFENARLFIRMRGILKIFSEKFLINLADFQRFRDFKLNF